MEISIYWYLQIKNHVTKNVETLVFEITTRKRFKFSIILFPTFPIFEVWNGLLRREYSNKEKNMNYHSAPILFDILNKLHVILIFFSRFLPLHFIIWLSWWKLKAHLTIFHFHFLYNNMRTDISTVRKRSVEKFLKISSLMYTMKYRNWMCSNNRVCSSSYTRRPVSILHKTSSFHSCETERRERAGGRPSLSLLLSEQALPQSSQHVSPHVSLSPPLPALPGKVSPPGHVFSSGALVRCDCDSPSVTEYVITKSFIAVLGIQQLFYDDI